jgi:putative ABC transport system ATP-binding protein
MGWPDRFEAAYVSHEMGYLKPSREAFDIAWNPGTPEPWNPGTLEPWNPGTLYDLSMSLVVADAVEKVYTGGDAPVHALRRVSFAVDRGDFVAVMGPSGCGKSTLLHVCGAMDRPSAGRLTFDGQDLAALDDRQLTRVRREQVGFVFQFFNLLPTLTLADNIALPCLLAGLAADEAASRARVLADRVGIAHRLGHYPPQVSGGEAQRAAIARALVHRPALVVADEPTGNLDSDNGAVVMALLAELNRELGATVLLATHAADVAAIAHRTLHMRDGQLVAVPAAVGA